MVQEPERLEEAVMRCVGQREAAFIDVGAYLHIIPRQQVVKNILVLDGN